MENKKVVAVDLETRDDRLGQKLGTGCWHRTNGEHVFMAGIYDEEPLTLPWTDETKNLIREYLDRGTHWVGANLKYDLNWLLAYGVLEPRHLHNNVFHDILIYAPLLDETQDYGYYSLDGQCKHYGLPTKPMDGLLEECAKHGLAKQPKTAKSNLWRFDRSVVAEYLRHDIAMPKLILEHQLKQLAEEGLERVAEVERKLLPVLCLMEQKGVRIDEDAAERLSFKIGEHVNDFKERLRLQNNGHEVNINPSGSLKTFLKDMCGLELPKTEKGNERCDAALLKKYSSVSEAVGWVLMARKAEKVQKTFCQDVVQKFAQNGRIHANINQVVGGDIFDKKTRGVKYGRFSYSNPNLQQIPKRDSIELDEIGGLGSAMRKLFIAEDGYQFMSADFAAQEPRWIVHWAEKWKLPGAARVGDMYRQDPAVSSHDIVASALNIPNMAYKQKRTIAKAINLGKGYEMGKNKLIEMLIAAGAPPQQADGILDMFAENFPHVQAASRRAMRAAKQYEYVRTYLGRKARFVYFEPLHNKGKPLRKEEAERVYTDENRWAIGISKAYTAFNRIVQGSSGDQAKMAIVELFYSHGIVPSLQIHDELCDGQADESVAEIYKSVMENVIQLSVPNLVEVELGASWGGA